MVRMTRWHKGPSEDNVTSKRDGLGQASRRIEHEPALTAAKWRRARLSGR
jgi:hypothetical protein